ncbi:phenylalanine--tRNA ligase subunit alpha [Patescibacteria group bacterium]|nr:phenylalanine--tRNA ligase subunit alpha [Patescibacteria group bacterium]
MEDLNRLEKEAKGEIAKTASDAVLTNIRTKWLGRKGRLTMVLRGLKDLPEEDRRRVGQEANRLKKTLEDLFEERRVEFREKERVAKEKRVDVTLPGRKMPIGHLHPLTRALREINSIFQSLGFSVVGGPEIETEWYNFDALNIPADHPARDMWDTFWLKTKDRKQKLLLRTHTSPVQIRYMKKHQPPFRIVIPGKVFRHEATDATHEMEFHQLEGLMVDKGISIAHFKHVIGHFFEKFFETKAKKIEVSLRPSFFPFTEPSFEVWISCIFCAPRATARRTSRKGCSVCKYSGGLEVAGAGMVHPTVFHNAGLNPKDVQGFAFGFGVERLVMMKYNIPDIRLFHSSDPRFLRQF